MFGKSKAQEQQISELRAALQRIAIASGIAGLTDKSPDQIATAICAALAATVESQVAPVAKTEDRQITADVHSIRLNGSARVILKQSSEPSLQVYCSDSRMLPRVITSIKGDTLVIDQEPLVLTGGNAKFDCIELGSIRMSGVVVSNNVQVKGMNFTGSGAQHLGINSGVVEITVGLPIITGIKLKGSGDIAYLDMTQDELDVELTGSGDIHLSGHVTELSAELSGSGSIDANVLQADKARLRLSGSGKIRVTAINSVKARLTGSGDIRIAGQPATRDTDSTGSGKISFR